MEAIWEQFELSKSLNDNISIEADYKDKSDICDNCQSTKLSEDRYEGSVVCTDCGIVKSSQYIDDGAEWVFGGDEAGMGGKDPARCGAPINPLLEKSSMTTVMTNASFAKHGNLQRLHQQTSMDYTERSRYHVFEEISKMGEVGKLQINVVEEAKRLYVKLSEIRLSRGDIRKGLIACCIYYSCKSLNVPRTLREIADICHLDQALVNKCEHEFKDIMKKNNIHIDDDSIKTTDICSRVANRLCLERRDEAKLIKLAYHVCHRIDEINILNGKTPSAIAPTVIFFCCSHLNYKISKKKITDLGGVSSVTLGKLLTILQSHKSELIEH